MSRFEIDKDYLLRVLTDLLNTPSPTGDTEWAVALVQNELEAFEVPCIRTAKGALIATIEGHAAVPSRRGDQRRHDLVDERDARRHKDVDAPLRHERRLDHRGDQESDPPPARDAAQMKLVITLFAALIATAAAAAAPSPSRTLVLLPPSNVSGVDDAPAVMLELLRKRIESRGWIIAPIAEVEQALEVERVRYFDSLPVSTHAALRQRFGASVVVVATVLTFRETADPVVAVSARMIDAQGLVVWGNLVALAASETEGALGFGRPQSAAALSREVAGQLMREFPRPGRRGHVEPGPASLESAGPLTYRSAKHPYGHRRRVCILPFASPVPVAPRIVLEVLTARLGGTDDFAVIEPAEFRAAMRATGLRSVASMTSAELAQLGKALGTMLFLRGNIHTWREGLGGRAEIQLDMNLADVETGEVFWAVSHERRGSDYSGFLSLGTVNSAVHLADRLISETILAQSRARLRTPGRNAQPSRTPVAAGKER